MRTSAAYLLLLALLAPPGVLAQSPTLLPAPLPAMPTQNAAARAARGAHDCLIEPSMVVNVGSPVDGVLEMVGADRGDIVRKGECILKNPTNTRGVGPDRWGSAIWKLSRKFR